MKAITIWQPWASLIADRVKTSETRSWRPPQAMSGQRIAIHAGLTMPGLGDLAGTSLLAEVVRRYGARWRSELPRGAVIATAILAGCVPAESVEPDAFGDYSPGRFAWLLREVEALGHPIPATGHQGLWEWEGAHALPGKEAQRG